MGRIVASVTIDNLSDPSRSLRCDALVDTGASHLVLPSAWKERLGDLQAIRTIELETAMQTTVQGDVYGPVKIQIEGFPPIFGEVLFASPGGLSRVDRSPEDGLYEPLLGYVILEQSQAGVDTLGHRLVHVKRMDLK